jgi:hypothetical protein
MPVKLFSKTFTPGSDEQDAFESEINNWSKSRSDLVTLSMDTHTTEQDGKLSVFVFVLYAFVPQSSRKPLVDNSPRRIF